MGQVGGIRYSVSGVGLFFGHIVVKHVDPAERRVNIDSIGIVFVVKETTWKYVVFILIILRQQQVQRDVVFKVRVKISGSKEPTIAVDAK